MNRLRVLILRCRAWWLQAQIDHGEELLVAHRTNLIECYKRLRKIKGQEAMLTPAENLLARAMRRKS